MSKVRRANKQATSSLLLVEHTSKRRDIHEVGQAIWGSHVNHTSSTHESSAALLW